ncbi:MAG: hypothetical protein AAF389_14890 [Gemmatimonadota bacterium]
MADEVLSRLLLVFGADTKDLREEMSLVDRTIKGVREEMTKTRSVTGLLAGAAGFGYLSKQAFELGSSVEETQSKFNTVFGDSTQAVQGFIDSYGTIAGLSDQQAQAVLSTTGSIVQGLGFAQQASAEMSVSAVQLAGDLSSFNNVPIEETSRAIQAALTGEREQLKRLGIVLREADVQQRALANSGKANASALTDQEKATATLQLITERAGVAVGDLARTQDSAANQARALGAEIQNLKEEFAVALLPIFRQAVDWTLKFIGGIKLLGVDVAVGLARMRLAMAKTFGDESDFAAALDNLHHTSVAAREMRLEIVGLSDDIGGLSGALSTEGGGSGNGGTTPLDIALAEVRDGLVQVPTAGGGAITLFTELKALAKGAADETESYADKLNGLRGILGKAGTIASLLGGLGPLGGLLSRGTGLLGSFAGFFADGGTIPRGSFGVVGEAGPELVSGPATVTPMGAGMPSIVINVPPARDPISFARDQQWKAVLLRTFRGLEADGFRAAT